MLRFVELFFCIEFTDEFIDWFDEDIDFTIFALTFGSIFLHADLDWSSISSYIVDGKKVDCLVSFLVLCRLVEYA